ncbi:TonB-dependent receptor domain-containing protein [Photobacterium sp. TY1-4]|uniref:TonB-dependent receptor domain-containing protein n=1 Tax=Photobacterium sp. TY1-4 TaxID=2899122 RepID=UPI0021BE9C3C|nr:TonB-dependent receptor [Photobacterium sp. TY1-4]UXI01170.1 TonB-dependent receptor [Photobacterium sp. TY1-4]
MKKTLLAVALAPVCLSSFSVAAQDEDVMVVTANRFEQSVKNVIAPVSVITKEDIDAIQAKSLAEVLRRLPGVSIAANGGYGQLTTVFVRGSQNVLIMMNGVRLGSATAGGVNLSQLPLTGIESIEYIRGTRAAVYGADATAGVINIITTAQPDDVQGQVAAGMGSDGYYQTKGSVAGRLTEQTWAKVAGNFEQADGFNVADYSSGAWLEDQKDNDGFKSKDILGEFGIILNDEWRAVVNAFYHDGQTEYDYTGSPGNNEADYVFYNVSGQVSYAADRLTSSLLLGVNRDEGENKGNQPGSTIVTDRTQVNWTNSYQLAEHYYAGFGVDLVNEKVSDSELWNNFAGQFESYDQESRRNDAGYITFWRDADDVQLEASVRYDDNEHYGSYTSWQLGAGWRFVEQMRVTANAGTGFKAPTFNDLYWPSYGNPGLEAEESENYELALEGTHPLLDWRVAVYDNTVSNQIRNQGKGKQLENQDVRVQGIELAASFATGSIHHDVSLDLMDHENESDKKRLKRVPDEALKWNASYLADSYQLEMSYLYQGDSRDTYFNPVTFTNSEVELKNYHLLDLAASYFVTEALTLQGRVANVLDEEYATAYGYNTAERSYYATVSYRF